MADDGLEDDPERLARHGVVERVPREEDVRRDERVGLGPRVLENFEDGGEDGSALAFGEGGAGTFEVRGNDLEPKAHERAVDELVIEEVGEGEAEDEVEEGAGGRDG